MKVTVLYGGPSAERDVSLVSGQAVLDGLRQAGHEVFGSDISPTNLSALDRPCEVVFPVLHGAFGESGELQEILEQRAIPFVGSSSEASRLGIDKVET
ncbi:MAG: D-alanine--D-alanine ligase, partial [Tepidisphaeraceae bacterium]